MSEDEEEYVITTGYDFGDGRGLAPSHTHINPDGTNGGVVENSVVVGKGIYISKDSLVYAQDENARNKISLKKAEVFKE